MLLLFILTNCYGIGAQYSAPMNVTWNDSARLYIKALSEGALVVRLHTRSMAIEQLAASGNADAAKKIRQEQQMENLEIAAAFRKWFSFYKVYFMYGDSTAAWLNGKRSGYFLNDSLEVDAGICLSETFSLLAEKGSPGNPAPPNASGIRHESPEQSSLSSAIILSDKKLNPLRDPFPGYAQEPFPQSLGASNWKVKAEALNRKLVKYYQRCYPE